MSSIYDKSSLVLIPSGTKAGKVFSQKPVSGDGDFTFTRSSAATRVNADGNIEKQTGNFILHSQDIDNSYWNKYQMSVTANQAVAPDGTTTADLIDDGTASAIHAIEENETIGFGGSVTISIHAKYVDTQYLVLAIYDTSYKAVAFDIQNGTIGNKSLSTLIPTIEDLGSGWYRCSVTHPTNTRNDPFYTFGLRDNNVAGFLTSAGSNRQAYVWGAQMEDGLVARDYIETTTSAVYGGITDNVPRLDYTDSSCPALLLEPLRTNFIDHSEYGGGWATIDANITKTDNAATSPEGVDNAVKLEGITGSGGNQIVNFGTTLLNGVNVVGKTYTGSIYIKPVNPSDVGKDITLTIQRNSGDFESLNVTFEIDSADWKRYEMTYTFTGAGAGNQVGANFKILRADTTIDDIYLWGVQLEEGSYATSYIPTYGSSVTRNGDICDSAGTSATFNDSEGVLYAEISALYDDQTSRRITISDGTNTNRIVTGYNASSNQIFYFIIVAGSTIASGSYTTTDITAFHKVAIKYKVNDFALWVDGVERHTDSSGAIFAADTLSEMQFTQGSGSGLNFYGNTKQVIYISTALTDAELQDLTTL